MEKRLRLTLLGSVFTLLVLLFVVLNTGCEATEESEPTSIESSLTTTKSQPIIPEYPGATNFVPVITNAYLDFEVGKVFHYAGETEDGTETVEVTVTTGTKLIIGVTTTVVHAEEFLDGELIEKTDDWFAQDTAGNVWYFGEYSEEYEDGEFVGTEGSWEAGVDGALPGIIMLANPRMGVKYQQEYYEGVAEDMGMVINLNKTVSIDYGTFVGCLETMDWTPLEPGEREHKFYKEGVGLLLELQPQGGRVTIELIAIDEP